MYRLIDYVRGREPPGESQEWTAVAGVQQKGTKTQGSGGQARSLPVAVY